MREVNPGTKWLDTPAAHIATASFIASGMVVALAIKLFLHNQLMVSTILGVAIAGASIPLLISLTQQVLKANFSVDILALLSIVTSIILGQYWVAAIVVLMLSGGQALEAIRYTGNWKGSMEGWLLTPTTGYQQLSNTLPGLRQFLMVGQWIMPGGGLPSGLLTARAAVQAICRHDRRQFVSREPVTT